jgi:hypothetical protein
MSRDKPTATSMAAAPELLARLPWALPPVRESHFELPESLLSWMRWPGQGRSPERLALPQPHAPSAFRASHDRRTGGAFRRPAGVRAAWAGRLHPPA